jgi:hypothetical protein
MKVIYRMCDITSTNASPIYWTDKFRLNEICLRSFVEAFKDVKPYVYMICDRCPDMYRMFVKYIVPFEMEIEFTQSGIRENAVHQYDYVKDNDIYLFQECDYLYVENAGKFMEQAAEKFDFISPYDHPDKYKEGLIPAENEREYVGNYLWRSTDSTTSTFMARGSKVLEQMELFRSYGWDDHKRWLDLGTKGYKLWTPLPSLATHMVEEYMAPGIDWKKEWKKYE